LERLTPGLPPVEQRAPGRWQIATVSSIKVETPRVKSFRLELPMWMPHLPGQHYDVRLTAPDGYRAQRSYSIASSPLDEGQVELTVDRLDDGEVSPYFHDVVMEGDQVEVRGPFASYFVWRGEAPVLLLGGGSGVVPLMSMLRYRRARLPEVEMKLIYSVRGPEDVIYARELEQGDETLLTYSRLAPPAWQGHEGRIDAEMVAAARIEPGGMARAYVCGSHGFVETAAALLGEAGFAPERILTERFGPTG
jgi:ferredoxin-NADP reductase